MPDSASVGLTRAAFVAYTNLMPGRSGKPSARADGGGDDAFDASVDCMARECIARRVRSLSRVVTSLYDEALRPLGLKVTQANILTAAAKLRVAKPAQVCRILHMDESTLSRNVQRMRANGWLEAAEGEDGRQQPFRLTPSGRELLARAVPAWERAQREARKLLGTSGERLLRVVLSAPE